jgi:hypothetical protein
MRDEGAEIEAKAGIDGEAAGYALRLARGESLGRKDCAEDERERRARWIAYAALRRIAPEGRTIEQALLLGWSDDEAYCITSAFSHLRQRARTRGAAHWLRADAIERVESGLRALLAGGEATRKLLRDAEGSPAAPCGMSAAAAERLHKREMMRRAESARRAALALRPSIGVLMGDPPPGRSALDRLRAEGRA